MDNHSVHLNLTFKFAESRLLSIALLAVIALTTDVAVAQDDAEQQTRGIEEIVVTAQLRTQNLRDVPASVQAISSDQMAAAGVGSVDSLVMLTPSVNINKFLTPYQASIRIRGVGTSVSAPTIESSVSMVVDGVVIARQGSFFTDLADIERIEILRGPQSTLFGKNSVAGAISITTRKPSLEEFSGMAEATYNDYGDLRTRATLNGPLAENVGASLTATYFDEGDGIHTNIYPGGPRLDDDGSLGLRGQLYWEVSDLVDWTLIADMRDAEGPNTVRTPIAFESQAVENLFDIGPVDRNNRTMNFNGGPFNKHYYKIDDAGLSLQGNIGVRERTFTSITAYREWDLESALDADQIWTTVTPSGYDDPVIIPNVGVVSPGRFPLTGSTEVWGNVETSQLSQEFRLISPETGRFRWLVGAYYLETELHFDNRQVQALCPFNTEAPGFAAPPPSPVIGDGDPEALTGTCTFPPPNGVNNAFRTVYDVDTTYWAIFGNSDFDITDRLTATVGIRYQEDDFDYQIQGGLGADVAALVPGTNPIVAPFIGQTSVSNEEVTGKAALTYVLTDNTNVYASYSRGYKGPGLDAPANARSFRSEPLREEYVDAYEIGFKSNLLDGRALLNVTGFWQEFENLQQRAYNPETSILAAINAGDSRQRGVEIDAQFYATEFLTLTGGLVYLDAEYTDFTTADCFSPRILDVECTYQLIPGQPAVGSKDVSGDPVIYSPEWTYNIAADYRRPIGNLNGFARVDYRFVDEQQGLSSQNPYTILDSYDVANLRLGLETADGKYDATVFVNNVFDESYGVYVSGYNFSGQVNPNNGNTITNVIPKGADRYYGITLRARF